MPWLIIAAAICLAAWGFSPLFGHFTAQASNTATAAVFDGGDDCDEELIASLTGATIGGQMPRGLAKFFTGDDDGEDGNRLKVYVRYVNLAAGTELDVFVNGSFVGHITLTDEESGSGSFSPNFTIHAGDVIEVRTGSDVILSGGFRHCDEGTPTHTPSHSPTRTPSHTPSATPSPSPCDTFVTLSGAQEVPPNNSPGTGNVTVTLSADHTMITVSGNFSDLTAPATAAHIHGPATPGQNAAILFPLSGLPNATSGTIPSQTFSITGTQAALLQPGLLYVNIHTSNFPGGEIRAQLTGGCGPTPTPTSTQTGTPSASPTSTFTATSTATATPTGSPTPQAHLFTTVLRGSRVVPPVETNARGLAGVLLNADMTQIQAFAAFINLSSSQTSASINCPAVPGENAPPVFNLGTVGGTSGFVNGTFAVTPLDVAELQAGLCYVVIGSVNHPDGEIRGQLLNRFTHRDFDGDGRSDVAVFRPSNGTWYSLNSSDGAFEAIHFGMAGDRPIAGDFDGDGRGEYAVFRNVNGSGVWYVQNSSDHSFVERQWGLGSDIPLSGDFDGDGRSDIAVFRPSDGNWYISRSSNGATIATHWGANGDIPMSADYDGDGISDMAVFRPSTGMWYVNRSSDGQYAAMQWGLQNDRPVVGDFDGDGIDDVAVFRSSDGNWYINGSAGGFISMHFGANGDIPVAGRFDDDTKTDFAVFRPSEGNWYILSSQTNSVRATNFGLNGDMPIVNY